MPKNWLKKRRLVLALVAAMASIVAVCGFICFSRKQVPNDNTRLTAYVDQAEQLAVQFMRANIRESASAYTQGRYSWDTERSPRAYTYFNGLMMYALARLGYREYVYTFYLANLLSDGSVNNQQNPYNVFREGEVDSFAPLRTLFLLPETAAYRQALNKACSKLLVYPRLPEAGNNYYHKKDNKKWEAYPFALDGLYMALPVLVQCASGGYLPHGVSAQQVYEDIGARMQWVAQFMRGPDGLYSHGINASGTQLNGVVWLRALGWYAMTQVDLINLLPAGPVKEKLKEQWIDFVDTVLLFQDEQTGLWRNVLNAPSDIANNRLETSGSAMLAYALLKSYNEGMVADPVYLEAGLNAFAGIMKHKVAYSGAEARVKDIYQSASVYTQPADYCVASKYVSNEAKGLAPLLLAAAEVKKWLADQPAAPQEP